VIFSSAIAEVESFSLKMAFSLEQAAILTAKVREHLKEHHILEPALDTLQRLIKTQREVARANIYTKIHGLLKAHHQFDQLLDTGQDKYTPLNRLKQSPGQASPAAFNKLISKLETIQNTGVLIIDMEWLNNNYQRRLASYARQCTTFRLRRLKEERRYAVLVCFLLQVYQDTFDFSVQMYDKLIKKVYNKADGEIDAYLKKRRRKIRKSLNHYHIS
jgi:hypothetical protein